MFGKRGFLQTFIVLALLFFCLAGGTATGEERAGTDVERLYEQAARVEQIIKAQKDTAQIQQEIEQMIHLYVQLDGRRVPQSIDGMQAVSAELIGLRQQYVQLQGPSHSAALFHAARLRYAFDALAHPGSGEWLQQLKGMEEDVHAMLDALKRDDKADLHLVFHRLSQRQELLGLALQLRLTPSATEFLRSADRFLRQQLQTDELDREGMRTALTQYLNILQGLTEKTEETVSPANMAAVAPPAWWAGLALLGTALWLLYHRRIRRD